MPMSRYHALTNGNGSHRAQAEATRRLGLLSSSQAELDLETRTNSGNLLNILMSVCPNTNYYGQQKTEKTTLISMRARLMVVVCMERARAGRGEMGFFHRGAWTR